MIRGQAGIRKAIWTNVSIQVFAVSVIAYGFLLPIGTMFAVLIGLIVSLFVAIGEALVTTLEDSARGGLANLWLNELTMRNAVDEIVLNIQAGSLQPVDWRAVTTAAVEDIKAAKTGDRLQDEMSNGALIDAVVYGLGLPVAYAFRVGLGWLIAGGLRHAFPKLVGAMTGA